MCLRKVRIVLTITIPGLRNTANVFAQLSHATATCFVLCARVTDGVVEQVQVLVTHVESPCQFYGQTMAQEEVDRMAIITEFLQQHTGRLQPINGNLHPHVVSCRCCLS